MTRDDWTGATVRLRDGRLCYVQDGRTRYLAVHSEDDRLIEVDRAVVTMTRPPIGYTAPVVPAMSEERTGTPWWLWASAALAVSTLALALVGSAFGWWTW